jgi:hypothetical protein
MEHHLLIMVMAGIISPLHGIDKLVSSLRSTATAQFFDAAVMDVYLKAPIRIYTCHQYVTRSRASHV